jgi:mercuric reductase
LEKFDLIIIGGGSAGFAAAIKASELGKKFAMIEKGTIGGTCVNVGCVPSKHLLHVGDVYYYSNHRSFRGIMDGNASLDFHKAIKQKDELVSSLRKSKYANVLKDLHGATFIEGKAAFISKNEIKVNNETLTAEKFLIATGSSPHVLDIKGIDKVHCLTNVEALALEQLPNSMIVIGGRALALEFAQTYTHFGTQVTVLQRSPRLLPEDEPEISKEITKCLIDEGIQVFTNVQVEALEEKDGAKIVRCKVEGKEMEFSAKQVLMATGRRPNVDDLGLGEAGVQLEKGFVKINDFLETSNPNVFAAGDCASPIMLETLAAKMGNIAVRNAFENANLKINEKEIPSVVFTNPQVAKVGYTEEEYSAKTHACACRTIPMSLVAKAQVINDMRGVIKMVVDPNTLKVVGVHIVSPLAAEMIHEATIAVKFGLTINEIIDTVHVFPTLSEAIKLVAQSFYKDIRKLSCCVE